MDFRFAFSHEQINKILGRAGLFIYPRYVRERREFLRGTRGMALVKNPRVHRGAKMIESDLRIRETPAHVSSSAGMGSAKIFFVSKLLQWPDTPAFIRR